MSRKRKLSNVKERCRICLVEQGCMTDLFNDPVQSKLNDLSKCTSIDIKDEYDLPNIICHTCLYKLDMWNEFKEQFIRSNQVLMSQLELVDTSSNKDVECKKESNNSEQSGEDNLSDTSDKKSKTRVSPLTPLEFTNKKRLADQVMLKDMYISDDDVTSSKDSSQRAHDVSNDDKDKNDDKDENKDKTEVKPSQNTTKAKSLLGKRGRTTEQRKASTKRWVERKKALLAATGESVSDSDSITSDDAQLSPVKKARAKTNLDKENEKQKRLSRVLKNLETNMIDRYTKHDKVEVINIDTDSDTRRTRSSKDINSDVSLTESKKIIGKDATVEQDGVHNDKLSEDSKGKENFPVLSPEKATAEKSKTDEVEVIEDTFTPCSVKSELEIGDATYIVTSTLMLAEPRYLNKTNLNKLSEECKRVSSERNSQEKNTDIIDAVQLRRITPIPVNSNDKKCVESCLNIEVEGTEIESLKRIQVELAGFIKKEIKHRLFGTNNNTTKNNKSTNVSKSSYQTLDQQLKSIIEKTIKKNFESSMMRSCGPSLDSSAQSPGRVSPTFVKEALNSKKYQPKVVLKRLDLTKESKYRNINNIHIVAKRTVKNKLGGPFSMVSHKRQSVPPIRYNDYNTSAMDSDSNLSAETEASRTSRLESNQNLLKSQEAMKNVNIIKQTEELKVINPGQMISGSVKNEQRGENQANLLKISLPNEEKHMCGVCQQSFNSYNDAVAHVRTHKTDGNNTAAPRPNKHKMMRCKRCHEIVEARFVKAHVCKSTKQQIHKCYVCNSTFRTEKLLVSHLENHDQSEFNIENITKGESQKPSSMSVLQNPKDATYSRAHKNQLSKTENTTVKLENVRGESEKMIKSETDKSKETYICFVCDKTFTDEEILKDHLQKHCDDMSEDDQSPGKEQYQCAICGDSLDSEDALEAHVEKHLFDEEDDNPNLINIANENEKSKNEFYQCFQCSETFHSEMLLEMHIEAHEEEAAIAEWEKQGIKTYEFQCMICDEYLKTEEDLTEHLSIHNGNEHVCQLCDKPFLSLEDLQKHVATH